VVCGACGRTSDGERDGGLQVSSVNLSLTSNRDYVPGRSFAMRVLWLIVEAVFFANPVVTSYRFKRGLLRLFGARVGNDVLIKPSVRVKYPWRLEVGDNCWIGEQAWIDNMEDVRVGSNVVVSQGAYICTGNHDWADPGMGLMPRPVTIEDGAWIGAFARIGPGRRVAEESIVAFGAVLLTDTERRGIYAGNPAELVRWRTIRGTPGPRRASREQVEA
jgi:putative colanic acid biosynthesis acetyltransferase WcaF